MMNNTQFRRTKQDSHSAPFQVSNQTTGTAINYQQKIIAKPILGLA